MAPATGMCTHHSQIWEILSQMATRVSNPWWTVHRRATNVDVMTMMTEDLRAEAQMLTWSGGRHSVKDLSLDLQATKQLLLTELDLSSRKDGDNLSLFPFQTSAHSHLARTTPGLRCIAIYLMASAFEHTQNLHHHIPWKTKISLQFSRLVLVLAEHTISAPCSTFNHDELTTWYFKIWSSEIRLTHAYALTKFTLCKERKNHGTRKISNETFHSKPHLYTMQAKREAEEFAGEMGIATKMQKCGNVIHAKIQTACYEPQAKTAPDFLKRVGITVHLYCILCSLFCFF